MLSDFLAEWGAKPWDWGSVDCCFVTVEWAIAAGHSDPAGAWRGLIESEEDWRSLMLTRGGLVPVFEEVFAAFPRISVPTVGAIAVIGSAGNAYRQWGAIHDGARWQVRLKEGFVAIVAPPLVIWSV